KLHVFSTGDIRLPLLLMLVAAALAVVVAWIVLSYLSRLVPEVCDLAKTAWKSSRAFKLTLWLSLVVITSFYFVLSYISYKRGDRVGCRMHRPASIRRETHEGPLWVISGHDGANMRCLLYPRKQTSSVYEYTRP